VERISDARDVFMTEREPSSIAVCRPSRQAVIAYGRKMGMTQLNDRRVVAMIYQCGGVEKLSKLTPEVQRLLLGIRQ
jgi:hypothetical protein